MIDIIPAVLPKSFSDLEDHLSRVVGLVPMVQIDVCDGKLTPKATWPYLFPHDDDFEKIIHEDEGLPYWEELDFEIDLMVKGPETMVDQWIAAGAKRIIVHRESFANAEETLSFLELFNHRYVNEGSLITTELGLAITLEANLEEVPSFLDYISVLQCMGIAREGMQGEPFDERVLPRIEALKEAFPEIVISVDGGVSANYAQQLVDAGVDRLVAGSAIFESQNPQWAIEELESFDNS